MTSAPLQKKTYDIVQQGIKELYTPENPDVDIIAVPGLGAPPLESWKSVDPKNEFNWLTDRDGLAKEFPRARILLYMYQSAWSGSLKVRQFMSNLAMTLLYGLHDKRKDAPLRPIVFIGHSMGGLVIAKAISFAESRRDLFGKMFEAISGCIFFGTPFDGAHAAAAASMFSRVSEVFGLDAATSSKLLDLMKPGDEGLRDIKNDFMRLTTKMSPKIELFCFYEEKPTDWSRQAGLPFSVPLPKKFEDFVTRESATLTGVDNIGLARVHRELVKFDSFKDTVYQLVRGPLKNIINGAPLIAKNRFNSTRGIDRGVVKGVLDALEGVQIDKKRKRLSQSVISSSWILQEEEYKEWFQKAGPPIDSLWVVGPEGKGKLGASLAAIDHIEEYIRQEETRNSGQAANLLAYFLCDSTAECSSPEELLKSLLRQLVNQQEGLAPYAKQFVKAQKESRGKTQAGLTVENLWQCLQDILTDDLIGTVYFIVNNLHSMDEEADSTKKLMGLISSDLDSSLEPLNRGHIRWLFTSQNRHSIKQALKDPSIRVIDLDDGKYGNQVQNELRLHAQKKIATLGMEKGYNKALTYFAGSLIGKRAQNTQWIDITIIQLAELPTDARDLKVRSLLERIPQDLRALLDRAWLSVLDPKDEKVEEIKEMLRTLIITYEEPTENDLAVLTGLSSEPEQRAHLCSLVEKCRPLLTFRKSGKGSDRIAFMNSIVKSHLLEHAERLLGLSVEEIRWQHGILALRSFTYLVGYFNEHEPPETGNTEQQQTTAAAAPVTSENDGIATDFGMADQNPEAENTNAEEQPEAFVGGMEELQFDYSDEEESEYDDDVDYVTEHIDQTSLDEVSNYAVKHWLHHASKATADIAETLSQEEEFWKRDSIVRPRWLKVYEDLTNAFDGVEIKGLTGLHVASSVGFAQLVTALMKNGYAAERDVKDTLENTPLHLAAFLGRPNITEILLNSGAKVDEGQDEGDSTPLAMAATQGHCRVMVKLLNRGANPNSLGQGGPVINEAIVSGNMEAVRLLVEHGAVLTHDDEDSEVPPPLALSALLSDLGMFTYLLEACADKIPDEEYSKALVFSAVAGRIEVTRRLMKFQHNAETLSASLSSAAEEANWDIMMLILESCQGLDCDEVFETVAVSTEQQDKILSAIWKHTNGTVSQETLSKSLYQATDKEKESTVRLLLQEFGANPNATGEEYGNALTAAAYDGTIDIIRMLLDHGANANSPDGWALQTAAAQGHLEVVELLLERGAHVNACISEDKFLQGTALQGACEAGQLNIVTLLLKHGADPNLGAGPLTCPIIAACRKGEGEILDLLVDAGATLNRFGGPDMSSPLINASSTLFVESVQKLLDAGADINLPDADGDTALIVAAGVDDARLTAFLLEKGADITHANKVGHNALKAASEAGAVSSVEVLVEAISRVFSALNGAVMQGNHDVSLVLKSVSFENLAPEEEEEEADGDADAGEGEGEGEGAKAADEDSGPVEHTNMHPTSDEQSTAAVLDSQPQEPTHVADEPTPTPDHAALYGQEPAPEYAHHQAYVAPTGYSYQPQTASNFQALPDYSEPHPDAIAAAETPMTPAESLPAAPERFHGSQAHASSAPDAGYDSSTSAAHAQAPHPAQSPQSPPAPPASGQITIADQLQAYQAYSAIQGSPVSQGYQGYQRPSRKPLNSGGTEPPSQTSYSSNQATPQNHQGYQNYQGYQGYQSQTSYQTPPPSQGYQSPSPTQGFHSPRPSQDYSRPQQSHEYQTSSPSQGYRSPMSMQSYQQQSGNEQYPSPQPSQTHRYPDYTPGQPTDPANANGKYRYNDGSW
ncbi:Ankyrin-1 [Drechslerella dactyloides]|uniref:Ankyrin-1 n=1 Tax=Drechslerella dactyloides TaxID=74499 RepID=A0AAD6J3Y5_DREDA|nr:Ankyrin-1 [Drechslerella dactyloides]